MPRITPIHWRVFAKVILFTGCVLIREEGDHRVYSRADLPRPIVVPRYNPLPVFILRNNLRILGIGHEEYLKILRKV